MSVEEIISSGLLECYVLGITSPEESAMINRLCKEHPVLLKEVEEIENGLINVEGNSIPLPGENIKNKIIEKLQIIENVNEGKIISLNKELTDKKVAIYKFAVAASALLFVTTFLYALIIKQREHSLSSRVAGLNELQNNLQTELQNQQQTNKDISSYLQAITEPGVKVVALKGANSLAGKSGVVYWNPADGGVYFNHKVLPGNLKGKQYQLWAIVAGKPVDAGVIEGGNGMLPLQKMKLIKEASAFAVTIEKMGGSESPSLETMCLLGNV